MATINFVNNTLISGTTANPGLEEVLDYTGSITQTTSTLYEITNSSGGQFNNFKFQLSGSGFAYSGTMPIAGTIDGITVVAPDGSTHIIEVTGALGNTDLSDFFYSLKFGRYWEQPDGGTASQHVFLALDGLLYSANTIIGSSVSDHATAFGFGNGNLILGADGDDVLWGRYVGPGYISLVGNNGNDTIRLEGGYVEVAGANEDGTGGAGQINTLEIRGEARFGKITNIDAVHFRDALSTAVSEAIETHLSVWFNTNQIGHGLVSLSLAVDGSTTVSPHSFNTIHVSWDVFDQTRPHPPVNLDLSGWTFTNWDQSRNSVDIFTSIAFALNDSIVGTSVADSVSTYEGNDTVRGGGGDDALDGGDGKDTLKGGAGDDDLNGGGGKDDLFGMSGADHQTGGARADTFFFLALKDSTRKPAGRDTILDFSRAEGDLIDLSAIDAKKGKGNQKFKFIEQEDFHEEKGELRYKLKNGDALVQGDVNGDGKVDFAILVDSITMLKGSEFEL